MLSNHLQHRGEAARPLFSDYPAISTSDRQRAQEVLAGLQKSPKEISPEWFYDEPGSTLYDMICELPEYYLTRVEHSIMQTHAREMARRIGPNAALIEFGSGTSQKTRLLLDRLDTPAVYVPVDIACIHLLDAASSIAREYPWLPISPICADFRDPIPLPARAVNTERRIVYFPGSTIGNFEPSAARQLLRSIAGLVGAQGGLLVGIDLQKEREILEGAYNDSAGLTAKFNLNALRHLNRELQTDFDLDEFEHEAVWVEEEGRIEMRLTSRRKQRVKLAGEPVHIEAGEFIRTECCYKYTLQQFSELAESAGFDVRRIWCDADANFSVQLLEPISRG